VKEREKKESVTEDKLCRHQPHELPQKKENGAMLILVAEKHHKCCSKDGGVFHKLYI